jgi:DNA-binding CsgD family transcriptional regulator
MEYPGHWDLLTASLYESDLERPFELWAYLVAQELVHDKPGAQDTFGTMVEEVKQREPAPGPSDAYLIATWLIAEGLATDRGQSPDPFGKIAKQLRHQGKHGRRWWQFWKRSATVAAFPEPIPQLTEREREILALLAGGRTNQEIARQLHLSPKAVRNHLANIFARLGVRNREAAIMKAREAGLLP